MTPQEQGEIGKLLAVTAESFGQPMHTHVIRLHLFDLADLPYEKVRAAIHHLRREPGRTRMFRAADIIKRATPEDLPESPDEIALRAWGAMSKDGRTNATRARQRIGAIGWEAIDTMGGWDQVCMSTHLDERGTWVAQFRNACSRIQERGPKDDVAPAIAGRDAALHMLLDGIGHKP